MINEHGSTGALLDFKHIRLLHKTSQLAMLPPGPKLIMATAVDLGSGLAQQVLTQDFATNAANLILLTQSMAYGPDSVAGFLLSLWHEQRMSGAQDQSDEITLNVDRPITVPPPGFFY